MKLSEVKREDFVYVYTDTEWAVKCYVTASYVNEEGKHVIQATDSKYNMKFVLDEDDVETTSVKGIFITSNLMGGRYVLDPYNDIRLDARQNYMTFASLEHTINVFPTYIYCLTYKGDVYTLKKYLVNKVLPLENNMVCLELENEEGKIIYTVKGDVSISKQTPTKYDENTTIWSATRDILLAYKHYLRDQLELSSCHKKRIMSAVKYDLINDNFDNYFEHTINNNYYC